MLSGYLSSIACVEGNVEVNKGEKPSRTRALIAGTRMREIERIEARKILDEKVGCQASPTDWALPGELAMRGRRTKLLSR